MAIRFIREVYDEIKRCDPEAIMLGEGATIDGPVNVIGVASNPVRPESCDRLGPRDFLLTLNQYAGKRIVVDGGARLSPAAGFCDAAAGEVARPLNRYMTRYLAEHGDRQLATPIPGDLSVLGTGKQALLVVPLEQRGPNSGGPRDLLLPSPWDCQRMLVNAITGATLSRNDSGEFCGVPPGLYRMQ
jgi:hypothetical protein